MKLLRRILRSDSPKLDHPFRALWGYALQGTRLSEYFELRRSRYRLPFYTHSNMALTYWVNPDDINPAEEFTYSYLRPGDTFIDIGANIGCVTAAASLAMNNCGRVFAAEPHPRIFRYLQRTVEVNQCKNVTCLNLALGDSCGTVSITDNHRTDDMNCVSKDPNSGIQVTCSTLESLVQQNSIQRIDLLKIDVEGFEMQVLRGGESVLAITDCVYIEAIDHILRKFGGSKQEVADLLTKHGFTCTCFRGDDSNILAYSPRASARVAAVL